MTSARIRREGPTWRVLVRAGGRGTPEVTVASGITTEREAKRLAKAARLAAIEAKVGAFEPRHTVGHALDAYLAHLVGRPSYGAVERVCRLHVRPAVDGIDLKALARPTVQTLVDAKVSEGLAPQTVRHIIGALRASWELARRRGLVGEDGNPAMGIVLPRVRKRAKDVLTEDEVNAVLPQLVQPWRDHAACAIELMLRPGELYALQPGDVDLERRIVTVRRSWEHDMPKDGDERIVAISDRAAEVLERRIAKGHALVFAARDGSMMPRTHDTKLTRRLQTAMVAAAKGTHPRLAVDWTMKCRRKHIDGRHCDYQALMTTLVPEARCPWCKFKLWPVGRARPIRWYDLRHTGASLWIARGVSPAAVSAMLGHHDVEFTMRTYVSLSATGLRSEIENAASRMRAAPVRRTVKIEGVG